MIYLDYQATTPLAPEAREAMLRWLDGPGGSGFGNPHSPHRIGRMARAAIEVAREQVAALLPPGGRVIFTSGATEAINLAIRGSGLAGTVAVSAIEHAAVRVIRLGAFDFLEKPFPLDALLGVVGRALGTGVTAPPPSFSPTVMLTFPLVVFAMASPMLETVTTAVAGLFFPPTSRESARVVEVSAAERSAARN